MNTQMISTNKITLIILLLVNSIIVNAQLTIKGKVYDLKTNTAISEAHISIKNSSLGTISNLEGEFIINIPKEFQKSSLLLSHLGYENKEIRFDLFNNNSVILLKPVLTELNEVVIFSLKNSLTADKVIRKAFNYYTDNFPDKPYISKGFLRHVEKNKKEYKWLIESAITMHDNSRVGEKALIKINIDQIRKSYDIRKVDSLNLYLSYLINKKGEGYDIFNSKRRRKIKDTVSTSELVRGIIFNDSKTNGLNKVFNGHKNIIKNRYNFDNGNQNIIRNYGNNGAMFDQNIFKKHQFSIDTLLLEGNRYVYKIKITPHPKMMNLNNVLKKNYIPVGWIFIYKDNFAIKEVEYALIASSKGSKLRNKLIFDTKVHYKVNLKYKEYNGKMYLNYFSCSVPKSLGIIPKVDYNNKDEYYYTKQEILFTEVVTNKEKVDKIILNQSWDDNLFAPRSYNKKFWKNHTILLENREQKKMIKDLEKKVKLKEQYSNSN